MTRRRRTTCTKCGTEYEIPRYQPHDWPSCPTCAALVRERDTAYLAAVRAAMPGLPEPTRRYAEARAQIGDRCEVQIALPGYVDGECTTTICVPHFTARSDDPRDAIGYTIAAVSGVLADLCRTAGVGDVAMSILEALARGDADDL